MANIYMRVEGVDVENGATVEGLPDKGWVSLDSYQWGTERGVTMDIGNANNADTGMTGMQPVVVTKELDNGSEGLLVFNFKPGEEGKTVWIAFTKPMVGGDGQEQYYTVKLLNARIKSFYIRGFKGQQINENIVYTYTQIEQRHWNEGEGGKKKQGGIISYNIPEGRMNSGS